MEYFESLNALIEGSAKSKALFDRFSPDAQVALQEQRQNIHTYDDLKKIAASFADRADNW